MTRRLVRLEPDRVEEVARQCAASATERDRIRAVLDDWGPCGRLLYVDDVLSGHIIWAPPSHSAAVSPPATAPVSAEAVLLAHAYVVAHLRGTGAGRLLVQAMGKDLLKEHNGIRAVEAFGRGEADGDGPGQPGAFLEKVGFRVVRAHARYPKLRMDLRTTLTLPELRDELGRGWGRLLGAVRPPGATAPETRQITRSAR